MSRFIFIPVAFFFIFYTNTETKGEQDGTMCHLCQLRFFFLLPWLGCFVFSPLKVTSSVHHQSRGHGLASPGVKTWFCKWACGLFSWFNRQRGLAGYWPVDSFAKQLIGAVLLIGWLVRPWSGSTIGTLFDSWLISGLVDRSCWLVVLVSSRPHSTGHSCPAVQLPAGPRRLGPARRPPLHPEARS